eukprot:TRINITY_DN912_c0_g1_i15.p2 TRINITY_DN912_c0_g1~~TRINITY_DN912_c0_g1_i15.p2  ORF type:complete len:190 (+),score=24.86 TRINITY_DN912_c0_g1_i15:1402-1971(+)
MPEHPSKRARLDDGAPSPSITRGLVMMRLLAKWELRQSLKRFIDAITARPEPLVNDMVCDTPCNTVAAHHYLNRFMGEPMPELPEAPQLAVVTILGNAIVSSSNMECAKEARSDDEICRRVQGVCGEADCVNCFSRSFAAFGKPQKWLAGWCLTTSLSHARLPRDQMSSAGSGAMASVAVMIFKPPLAT